MGLRRSEPRELTELNASEAIAAMVRGDIKAEDYARALLDRSARLQALNAFRVLSPDAVLEFDALPGTDRQLLGLGVSLQRALGSIQAPQVE